MRRSFALAGLAALWLVLSATGAGGHALVRDSTPADGALLDAAPPEVAIAFSEPPDLGLSTVEVVDASGAAVETGPLERGETSRDVRVSLPDGLPDGVYTVSWRVLSTVDGHITAGAFSFGVGVEPAAVAPVGEAGEAEAPDPTFLSVAGRWALYWGLAILLGGALGGILLYPVPPAGWRWLLGGAWVTAALGLVGMLLAEANEAGIGAGALLSSDRGELLIARGAALAAVGLAAAASSRRPGWILAAATAAAMLVHAYAGHAGAAETAPWLWVGVQWLHIVAVSVWIGGLAWLLLILAATRHRPPPPPPDPPVEYSTIRTESGSVLEYSRLGPAVGRFSRAAGYALAVVAVTGVLRAWNEVGSIGALFDTGFGLAAAGKSALFVGLLGLGAYNRFRLVPAVTTTGDPAPRLRRTVSAELAIAAGVFGLTGIMAGLVPPATVEAAAERPDPDRVVVTGSDFATTVRVRLAAAPGTPGPNTFEVGIEGHDTGEPLEARSVTLRFSLPDRPDVGRSELALTEEEPGRWTGRGTNLSVEGTWRVGVLIQQAADSVQVELDLETRTVEPEIRVVEGGPGQPDLYDIILPGGVTVQGYVDPGTAGPNEVHFTFFDQTGAELPIAEAAIRALPEGEDPVELEPRRLSPGHFVARAELGPGPHDLSVEAETEDGIVLTAAFQEEIA